MRRSPATHSRTPYERAASIGQLRADFNPDLRSHSHRESVNLPVRFTAPTTPASHAPTSMRVASLPSRCVTVKLLYWARQLCSSHTSPVAAHQPVSAQPRLGIRADAQYEYTTGMWHIIMELPGVKKSDINIELWTNLHSHNRQVTVSGISRPAFPAPNTEQDLNAQMNKRERRYGDFLRSWSVPPNTQVCCSLMFISFLVHISPHLLSPLLGNNSTDLSSFAYISRKTSPPRWRTAYWC